MKNNDEPAFPRDHRYDGHNGMSLRDYFAAAVIPGLYASKAIVSGSQSEYAKAAYLVADAMLAERGK